MKIEEKNQIMNWLKNNINKEVKEQQSSDEYIDFADETSFGIYDIEECEKEYNKINEEIEEYIEENNLDNVNDNEKIQKHFEKFVKYMYANQACIYDFKDFLKIKIEME